MMQAKARYLAVMEKALQAYSPQEISAAIPPAGELFDDIHWCARVASVIGILLSVGRAEQYRAIWEPLMNALVDDFPQRRQEHAVDFAVKEIMLRLPAVQAWVPQAVFDRWLARLAQVKPYEAYGCTKQSPHRLHNINVYNMVGELLRGRYGLTDPAQYLDDHLAIHMAYFDENGMYRDPGCPMLYDTAARVHFQLLLHFGYRGRFAQAMDRQLAAAGKLTLYTQSACFEFPYGGRSNQYLFNEAYMAASFEYEAARHLRLGDDQTAGQFKRAARRSMDVLDRWLNGERRQHIKNFYPVSTLHGCEGYGYYAKYMITLACFAYIAYLFADDTIQECPIPAEGGRFVVATSEHFHKLFVAGAGQSLEIDTRADIHYDATGIGRYHVSGVPSEYLLSTPFAREKAYTDALGGDPAGASICPGVQTPKGIFWLSEAEKANASWEVRCCDDRRVSVVLQWEMQADALGNACFEDVYTLDSDGLHIQSRLKDGGCHTLVYSVPYFVSNGRDRGMPRLFERRFVNRIGLYAIEVMTQQRMREDAIRLSNRNGLYGRLIIGGTDKELELVIKSCFSQER